MSDLAQYPDHIPADTFARLIALFGGSPPQAEDARRLWHVIGYALGQWDSRPVAAMLPAGTTPLHAGNVVERLKAAFPQGCVPAPTKAVLAPMAAAAFDWKTLASLVLSLIQQYLSK